MLGLPSAWGLSFAAREVSSPLPSALVSCFEGRGCHRRQGPRVRTAFLLDQSLAPRASWPGPGATGTAQAACEHEDWLAVQRYVPSESFHRAVF